MSGQNDKHSKCLVGEMIQHNFLFKISLKNDSNFGKYLTLKKNTPANNVPDEPTNRQTYFTSTIKIREERVKTMVNSISLQKNL